MARWSKCDVPVKVVRESWRVPKMEWLFEPQTLADEVHVAQAVLPAGEGGTAVHVMNKTPSSYIVDEGSEVGHANMAGDVCLRSYARYTVAIPPAPSSRSIR